jgi:hypothetical protein
MSINILHRGSAAGFAMASKGISGRDHTFTISTQLVVVSYDNRWQSYCGLSPCNGFWECPQCPPPAQCGLAANFADPGKEIAHALRRRPAHRAVLSFGATNPGDRSVWCRRH